MSLSGAESRSGSIGQNETELFLKHNPAQQQRRRVIHEPFSRLRHWRNLIILSLTFLICFTSFEAIQNIQSSINSTGGLGLYSLGTIYVSLMISCLVAPAIIRFFGLKWTIVFATLCYCIYSYANLFPSPAVLMPASVLLGFSAAPLWVAQGTYLTTSAIQLAALADEVPEFVISRFNGVFFAILQTNQIWGNVLSHFVLNVESIGEKPENLISCGAESCGAVINSDATPPTGVNVDILFALQSVIGMVAVLLAICIDPLPSETVRRETESTRPLMMSTVRLMGRFYLFLLIPLFVYSGVELAFFVGDFTKSFVTCSQGVSTVGLVMIAYGISDTISCLTVGQLEKVTGRAWLITIGSLLHLGLMVFMYLWDPVLINAEYLYLIAVGWGIGNAVFQTQCASIIGVIFAGCQEPAFSNYRFWQSAGFWLSFLTSIPDSVCVWHKIIGIGSLLVVALFMYYICEYKIRRETRQVLRDKT